jgi:hypothetical protein
MFWQEADATDSFQKGCVDFGSGQAYGEIVQFLDRKFLSIDGKIEGCTVRVSGVIDRLGGKDDVVGREGVPIGPKNSGAKVKSEGFIVWGDVPAGSEAWFDLLSHSVVADERIEKEADESAGGSVL